MKKRIYLALLVIVSTIIDISLSYYAYLIDSARFIEEEMNREMVYFFVDGNFPLLTIAFTVGVAFYVCFYVLKKFSDSVKLTKRFTLLIVIVSSAHIVGGLTWFHPFFQYLMIVIYGLVIWNVGVGFIQLIKYAIEKERIATQVDKRV